MLYTHSSYIQGTTLHPLYPNSSDLHISTVTIYTIMLCIFTKHSLLLLVFNYNRYLLSRPIIPFPCCIHTLLYIINHTALSMYQSFILHISTLTIYTLLLRTIAKYAVLFLVLKCNIYIPSLPFCPSLVV